MSLLRKSEVHRYTDLIHCITKITLFMCSLLTVQIMLKKKWVANILLYSMHNAFFSLSPKKKPYPFEKN